MMFHKKIWVRENMPTSISLDLANKLAFSLKEEICQPLSMLGKVASSLIMSAWSYSWAH